MHITPDIIEATYELLRACPPFKGWRLPDPDDVEFVVLRTDAISADHGFENGRHTIRISHRRHHTLRSLTETVAHEMIHMREVQLGVRKSVQHGAVFQRLAKQVCTIHCFDRGQF